jgi:hypothetical protein
VRALLIGLLTGTRLPPPRLSPCPLHQCLCAFCSEMQQLATCTVDVRHATMCSNLFGVFALVLHDGVPQFAHGPTPLQVTPAHVLPMHCIPQAC